MFESNPNFDDVCTDDIISYTLTRKTGEVLRFYSEVVLDRSENYIYMRNHMLCKSGDDWFLEEIGGVEVELIAIEDNLDDD